MGKRWPHFFDHAGNSGVIAGDSIALSSIREIRGGVSLRSAHASRSVCLPPLKRCSFATGPYLIWIEAASVPGSADTAEGLSQGGGPPHRGGEKSREKLHMCEEETMIKFKFLALVMLASAVAVSSTSAFAQTHKRTHYHSSNSMNVIRGPVERQPTWVPSPGFDIPEESRWGGG